MFGEIFIGISSAFVPKKHRSKKVIKVVAVITGALVFISLIFGVGFLIDSIKNFWGWLLVSISVVYVVVAIVVGFLRDKK